jgi:hypothetical protein
MPRGCDHSVHVHLENRRFIVEYNEVGDVLRIKERKPVPYAPPNSKPNVCDVSWWVATSHPLGIGMTLPKRVILAAEMKKAAEDKAYDAAP